MVDGFLVKQDYTARNSRRGMVLKEYIQGRQAGLLLLVVFCTLLLPMTKFSVDLLTLDQEWLTQMLALFTQTAGTEGFWLTLIALILWTVWCAPTKRQQWIDRGLQLVLLLAISLVAKVGIKQITHSPRPYTETMAQVLVLPSAEHFYRLDTYQQEVSMMQMEDKVSPYRLMIWQQERDYSFPSGHTVFATLCLVFFGGLFVEYQRWLSVMLLLGWSATIGFSRLWLGMHRIEDLWGAAVLVGIFYLLVPKTYSWSASLSMWLTRNRSRQAN